MDEATLRQILNTLLLQKQNLDHQIAAIQDELARRTGGHKSDAHHTAAAEAIVAPRLNVTNGKIAMKDKGGRPRDHERCTVAGCTEPHVAKGLCGKHYAQERRRAMSEAKASRS